MCTPYTDSLYSLEQRKFQDLMHAKNIMQKLKQMFQQAQFAMHPKREANQKIRSFKQMKSVMTGDSKFAMMGTDGESMSVLANLEKRLWFTNSLGSRHMNLEWFKTVPCANPNQHNPKHCPYFHGNLDKRRCATVIAYSVDFCKTKNCQNQDCKFTHNKVERLYHIERYKTKFCAQTEAECEYQQYCSFAHSDTDIKTPLIHKMERDDDFYMYYFKTEWCPYNQEHNKAQCVYAHNW